MAFSYGADAIGLVSEVSSLPGVLSENQIREITQIIPPSIDGFVLTHLTDSWDLIDLIRNVKNRTIQLVDKLGIGNYLEIRSSIPCVKIVQVIHVRGEESIEEAMKVDPFVDAILLDSGIPDKDIPGIDETGRVHDWLISRQIVELVETPVFLSGGLNADNITEAIEIEKAGLKVNFKEKKELILTDELLMKFKELPLLKTAFEALTPGRQRAYTLYFSAPKQS